MTRKGGVWSNPERVFTNPTSNPGLIFTSPNETYFVSRNQVFRLTDMKKAEAVLTLPDVSRLLGLALLPPGANPGK